MVKILMLQDKKISRVSCMGKFASELKTIYLLQALQKNSMLYYAYLPSSMYTWISEISV